MYTFPELIKKIREEAGLTQPQFANAMKVSSALIAMIETGQKEVSKKFVIKLAGIMNVHPASITSFLFTDKNKIVNRKVIGLEAKFIKWGEKMQGYLINDRVKFLKKYAK